MNNEPIKHDQNYPPSASGGGDNAYYLKGCEAVERVPAYASCLYKLVEYEAGRSHQLHSDCHNAMRQHRCRAVGMREEEKLKGAALYYFPRKPPQALLLPFATAGDFGVRITNLTDPALIPKDPKSMNARSTPVQKAKPVDALDQELDAVQDGYAAAITAAVAKTTAAAPAPKPEPKAEPAARPTMLPGETPLQYARRIAATRIST
jgi:hypothetical protein